VIEMSVFDREYLDKWIREMRIMILLIMILLILFSLILRK